MFERLWVRVHPADIRIDILSYRILCTNCNSSNSLDLNSNTYIDSLFLEGTRAQTRPVIFLCHLNFIKIEPPKMMDVNNFRT